MRNREISTKKSVNQLKNFNPEKTAFQISSHEEEVDTEGEYLSTVYGLLPASLQCAPLGMLCNPNGVQTGPFGSQLHKKDYVTYGTPIITVEHLGKNRIIHENLPRITDSDKFRLSKYILKTGDIVFSRVGSVDRRALVHPAENGWLFSGRCLRVRPNTEKIDSVWLSYFFGMPAFSNYIRGIAVGATMPSLNTKLLSDVPIYFPVLEVQKKASKFLAVLDERISLLQKTNETLESIAQALFKSWFIDFDPVRAKAEGRDPEGLDPKIAALFPDSFEESRLGAIPKGWSVAEIGNLVEAVGGGTPSTQDPSFWLEGHICWATPKDLSNLKSKVLLETEKKITSVGLDKISSGLLPIGTVLLSSRAPIGYLAVTETPTAINQGFIAIKPNKMLGTQFLLHWVAQNMGTIKSLANGSTFQEINKKSFRSILCFTPNKGLLDAFEKLTQTIHYSVTNNIKEQISLEFTRDLLLPRLISGQLQIENYDRPLARKIDERQT